MQAPTPEIMLTSSGVDYRPARMDPSDVRIEDVAHALSLICRFNGHCQVHYSVAQHSLLVVRILEHWGAPASARLAGLLHDAHEAYIGDIPTPIKAALGSSWSTMEAEAERVVRSALCVEDLCVQWEDLIKHADLVALATERRDLMRFDGIRNHPWPILQNVEPFQEHVPLGGWSPLWWADVFLDAHDMLRRACESANLPRTA